MSYGLLIQVESVTSGDHGAQGVGLFQDAQGDQVVNIPTCRHPSAFMQFPKAATACTAYVHRRYIPTYVHTYLATQEGKHNMRWPFSMLHLNAGNTLNGPPPAERSLTAGGQVWSSRRSWQVPATSARVQGGSALGEA